MATTTTTTTRAYRGKYPHRIASVGSARGLTVLTSNAGQVIRCDSRLIAASSGGRMPKLGQDIREFMFAELKA